MCRAYKIQLQITIEIIPIGWNREDDRSAVPTEIIKLQAIDKLRRHDTVIYAERKIESG